MSTYIALILVTTVFIKQLSYMKNLMIFTKKSKIEICMVLAGVLVLAIITYCFAKEWNHYLLGLLAILTLIALWMKQGISTKGIIQQFRGKELYLWNEISRVDIEIVDNIKVKYFGISNAQIGSLNFERKNHEILMDILTENVRNVNQKHFTE